MKLPEIKGFIDVSLVDWDGKVTGVIFLPRCNFRCPFCHNSNIVLEPDQMPTIPFKRIRQYLIKKQGWLDGVVITGGEPTIHGELYGLCRQIKELDLKVKLDTNGTNPRMVEALTTSELVDYVAMDVKAPLNLKKYSKAAGIPMDELFSKVKRTIKFLLRDHVDYEFRTTLVPTIHDEEDLRQIQLSLQGCQKYVLQNFKGNVETINPKYKNVRSFSQLEMESFKKLLQVGLSNVIIR
jgi:pyruvate formate lyase activating enzyme